MNDLLNKRSSGVHRPTGMFAFSIVWLGQLISLLGSAMTGFALTFWVWQATGQATALALVGFFAFAPTIFVSPLAGALVDRWNRKFVMMLSDLAPLPQLLWFCCCSPPESWRSGISS